jgi:hypothetical protein
VREELACDDLDRSRIALALWSVSSTCRRNRSLAAFSKADTVRLEGALGTLEQLVAGLEKMAPGSRKR